MFDLRLPGYFLRMANGEDQSNGNALPYGVQGKHRFHSAGSPRCPPACLANPPITWPMGPDAAVALYNPAKSPMPSIWPLRAKPTVRLGGMAVHRPNTAPKQAPCTTSLSFASRAYTHYSGIHGLHLKMHRGRMPPFPRLTDRRKTHFVNIKPIHSWTLKSRSLTSRTTKTIPTSLSFPKTWPLILRNRRGLACDRKTAAATEP